MKTAEHVASSRPSRPRGPGVAFAVIALALLVIVATIALTRRSPPPPTIAEFAPQAVENISDSPTDQASGSGRGQGAPDAAGEGAAPPSAATVMVPRAHRCVGDPPRQIEDPQSPPCVPYWEGDNGGATSKGVTRNEIRLAQPTDDGGNNVFALLAQFFNKRFEFYGRKLVVLPPTRGGYSGSDDPVVQRSEAADQDANNVFASLMYRANDGLPYRKELARRKVISMGTYWANGSETLQPLRPYMWQYHEETDRTFDALGRWVCRRLAGRPTSHGGADQNGKIRQFGVIVQVIFDEGATNTDPLETSMQSECGAKAVIKRRNPIPGDGRFTVDPVAATNTMVAFKDAGVTSAICLCNFFSFGAFANSAQAQNYKPEWPTGYSLDLNGNFTLTAAAPEQLSHTFGIVSIPRQVSPDREPYWAALKEIDPSTGRDAETSEGTVGYRIEEYRNLLLYASGIQMAGPHLTPETFEAALHRTTFPNPAHPLMAGAVGFPRGAHGMTTDYAEYWYWPAHAGPYSGESWGTMCYANGGKRYSAATVGSDGPDPFFNNICDGF